MGYKHRKIEIGKSYYRLTPIAYLGIGQLSPSKRGRIFRCKCSCGNTIDVAATYIGRGIKSCGCLQKESRERLIEPGTIFGRLTVLKLCDTGNGKGYRYLCRCSCGKEKSVLGSNIRQGYVRSCGCWHDELLRENAKIAYKNNSVDDTNIARISSKTICRNSTSGVTGVS